MKRKLVTMLSAWMTAATAFAASSYAPPPEPSGSTNSVQASTKQPNWYWVPIKGAKCRHDAPDADPTKPGPATTGIAVRYRPGSPKVVITLQSGGACFSSYSCGLNIPQFGYADLVNSATGPSLYDGIWRETGAQDDLTNYTEVFVPYCTGDLFAGNNPVTKIFGVYWPGTLLQRPQNFAGYKNMGLFFDYIVGKLLPDAATSGREVLISGYSAGGFGATLNAPRLRTLLDSNTNTRDVKLAVLNDSGPFFDPGPADRLMSGCVQQRFYDTWALSKVLETCPTCTPRNWGNPFVMTMLRNMPNVGLAFTSSTNDAVIKAFIGTQNGGPNCGVDVTAEEYMAGLNAIRDQLRAIRPNGIATFYIPGTDHTIIEKPQYFSVSAMPVQPLSYDMPRTMQVWVQNLFTHPQLDGTIAQPLYENLGP